MIWIPELPDDVLVRIFHKSCEQLSFDNLEWNFPRPRRYPVIRDARAVCRRWRQLIDYYDHEAYNKKYFWYTYSYLEINTRNSLFDLATCFSKFKWSLDASQNSDIWLTFHLPQDWVEDAVKFVRADAASLGLFIRCVDYMIPHQEQIVHYEIIAAQPQFLSHLLNLLVFRMKRMHRRPTINFLHPLPPLSDVISSTSILPSRLLDHPVTTMSSSIYPVHLEHFDLTKHNLSWLDGTLMKFPFSITTLAIPLVNLLKASSFFNAVGSDLVSLTINSRVIFGADDKEFELPKECIVFSKLLRLIFSSANASWTESFLNNTVFPCLESVELISISEQFPSSESESEILETSVDFFGQRSVYPALYKLRAIDVASSRRAIFCITRFMQCTIRDLSLNPDYSWKGCASVHLLKPYLESIQPEILEFGRIHVTNLKRNLAILFSLNLTAVQKLVIQVSDNPGLYQQTCNDCHLFMAKLGSSPIKSPLLYSISFRGVSRSDLLLLKYTLGCLETRSLTTLQLDFSYYHESRLCSNVFDLDARVDRLPSIISLSLSISGNGLNDHDVLVNLLSFTPRIQQLTLSASRSRFYGCANIGSITNLFTTLTAHDSQGLLLPDLSSFRAKIEVDIDGQENFLDRTRGVVLDCLKKRHHSGVISLGLCDLSFTKDPLDDKYGVLEIVFKHVPEEKSSNLTGSLTNSSFQDCLPNLF